MPEAILNAIHVNKLLEQFTLTRISEKHYAIDSFIFLLITSCKTSNFSNNNKNYSKQCRQRMCVMSSSKSIWMLAIFQWVLHVRKITIAYKSCRHCTIYVVIVIILSRRHIFHNRPILHDDFSTHRKRLARENRN